ncbi:MAG: hypothetical protein Q6366_008920 [Candidatus Freyarchaeota archaeon]
MVSRAVKLPKCTFHPEVIAVGKCVNCGRYFCNFCLEVVEKLVGERCVECLSANELKQRTSIKKFSLLYVTGFLASLTLAVLGFQSIQPPYFTSALMGEYWWITVMDWMEKKTPEPIVWLAIVATIGFVFFAFFDVRGTLKLRRTLPEHGFCPKCGKVLFGNRVCQNCGKELLIPPPEYPDIKWLRDYLKMKEKTMVNYEEELARRRKAIRTKYRRRKRIVRPPE